MDWVVNVSEAERAAGEVSPPTARAAYNAIHAHGVVTLRGALDTAFVDALRAEFDAQWSGLDNAAMLEACKAPPPNPLLEVGEKRYEILLRLKGRFADPDLFGNYLLCRFLAPMLGESMKLSGLTAVTSFPGSDLQHVHRDHGLIYQEPGVAAALPPYAINVAVPLVDVDGETGPTAFCLGSHRWPPGREPRMEDLSAVEFQRGDCVLIDYRTYHTGLPNRSQKPRPIIYMVYTRTWFFDEINHRSRPSLDMGEAEFMALPEPIKSLAERAWSQRLRARYLAAGEA